MSDQPRKHPERYRSFESPGPVSTTELDRLYAEGWQLVCGFPYAKIIEGKPKAMFIYYFEKLPSPILVM